MSRIRVLLVDDEPEIASALSAWMLRRGFDVTLAEGPAAADQILREHKFDVVLSDIQMPGNYNLEWIAERLDHDCPPPVLLMTGNPQLETAMLAANLPIAGYLLKPLFYEEAALLIERLAADHRRRAELLALSRAAHELISGADASNADTRVRHELQRLVREFAHEARRSPRVTVRATDSAPWRNAIADTIAVLEKTKHSFRSKELGELRRRLQRVLTPVQPTAAGSSSADFATVPAPAAE